MFDLKKNLLVALGITVLIIVGFLVSNNSTSNSIQSSEVITPMSGTNNDLRIKAPDFTLMTLEGEKVNSKDFRGKVVLVNFWATWCAPCRAEIPDLVKLKEKHAEKGFDILAVTVKSGTRENIAKFAKKFNMNYWVLISEKDSDINHIISSYEKAIGAPIQGIPTTFLIDREGYIRRVYIGARSEVEFWKDIQIYL